MTQQPPQQPPQQQPQPQQPQQPAQAPMPSIPDFRPKSRMPLFAAGGGGLVVGALVTAAIMTATRPHHRKHTPPPPKTPASASAAPSASASAKPPGSGAPGLLPAPKAGSLAAKAEKGDADAVKKLEAMKPQARTSEQSVALVHAHAIAKRKEIAELLHKIELVPKLAKQKETKSQLHDWANDAEVAPDLALALGQMKGELGPDLLYKLGPGYYRKVAMRDIADDVLVSKDVRPKASAALGALLDLRAAEKCEDVKKALEKVKTVGDRRAIRQIVKYRSKYGCGPKKTDDCYPCLRDSTIIKDTLKEVAKRHGP